MMLILHHIYKNIKFKFINNYLSWNRSEQIINFLKILTTIF
jgi:hypothetical protein